MCAGGFSGPKSSNRIELSWFVQELLSFFWFGFPQLWGVGQVGGGCLGWSTIVYMSSGMFRSKESSNRIELSQLVQELLILVFQAPCSSGGWGGWGGVGWGMPPHMCTCMHTHACTHTLVCMVNMIISCKWLPKLGESMGIPYDVIRMCVCVHAHACAHVWGALPHHLPPPSTHTHPPGGSQNQSKFNSTWTNRDISILFEDMKSVETSPPKGGCIVWWVGGWVNGWGQVKSLKI